MAKRILIVSYHFYPDIKVGARRMSELARYLCQQGHEVVVVAAKPEHRSGSDAGLLRDFPHFRRIVIPQPPKLLPFLLPRIKRIRFWMRGRQGAEAAGRGELAAGAAGREGVWCKLRRLYLSLEWLVDDRKFWATLVAGRLLGFAVDKPFDVVISSGPPMSGHLAVLLARPVLRGRWLMDLRDPWSDQDHWRRDIQSGVSRKVNRWLEARAVASANVLSVTTPGYARVLRQRYPNKSDQIQLILNGFEGDVAAVPPPRGSLQLLYTGSLYYNRDPFPLLRALRDLLERPNIERSRVSFRLFGECSSWNEIDLAGWVRENGLQDCVSIHPPVTAAEATQLMIQANVLVNFAQGQPMQIPAKMFDYIATRRDILLITELDSDSAWLGRKAGCASIVAPYDSAGMEAALASLYEKYVAMSWVGPPDPRPQAVFSRAGQNERFLELLQGAAVVGQEAGL